MPTISSAERTEVPATKSSAASRREPANSIRLESIDTVQVKAAIEAGTSGLRQKYIGPDGAVEGIERFGESASGDQAMAHFGFTVANIMQGTKQTINRLYPAGRHWRFHYQGGG